MGLPRDELKGEFGRLRPGDGVWTRRGLSKQGGGHTADDPRESRRWRWEEEGERTRGGKGEETPEEELAVERLSEISVRVADGRSCRMLGRRGGGEGA